MPLGPLANLSGVIPYLLTRFTSAPAFISNFATAIGSLSLLRAANIGVLPSFETALTSAPLFNSSCTTSGDAYREAAINGVENLPLPTSKSAPSSIRNLIIS